MESGVCTRLSGLGFCLQAGFHAGERQGMHMVTNVDAVTVFNGRTDKKERRKIFLPTVIQGVSYVEAKGAVVTDNGVWSSDVQYKIRIPWGAKIQDGRIYLPCLKYEKLEDEEALKHWTIRKEDLVIQGAYDGEERKLFEDELAAYAKEQGLDLIRITEYADNTLGGSIYTRHWRIGGK